MRGAHRATPAHLQELAAKGPEPVLPDHATEAALAGRAATETLRALVLPGSASPVGVHALKAR